MLRLIVFIVLIYVDELIAFVHIISIKLCSRGLTDDGWFMHKLLPYFLFKHFSKFMLDQDRDKFVNLVIVGIKINM